jgi:hypothetical protein
MRTKHGFLTIETRRLPVIDVAYSPPGSDAAMLQDFREAFEEYARIARRGAPVAYLLDMRNFDLLQSSAAVRKEASNIFHEYRSLLLPVSVAEARVITSPMTRCVVTAFDWLTGANKWPCQQFRTPDDAETWLRGELRRFKGREGWPESVRRI